MTESWLASVSDWVSPPVSPKAWGFPPEWKRATQPARRSRLEILLGSVLAKVAVFELAKATVWAWESEFARR